MMRRQGRRFFQLILICVFCSSACTAETDDAGSFQISIDGDILEFPSGLVASSSGPSEHASAFDQSPYTLLRFPPTMGGEAEVEMGPSLGIAYDREYSPNELMSIIPADSHQQPVETAPSGVSLYQSSIGGEERLFVLARRDHTQLIDYVVKISYPERLSIDGQEPESEPSCVLYVVRGGVLLEFYDPNANCVPRASGLLVDQLNILLAEYSVEEPQ